MTESLRERVEAVNWYHTIELEPGLTTPGWFDTRRAPEMFGFPRSFEGKRCLDVGTFDGFWAFEMERRGAAEVVAIDLVDTSRWDWPVGCSEELRAEMADRKRDNPGFAIASEALGSKVQLMDASIYELDPDGHGMFDFVFVGSLLIHLRDPIGGLEAARSVCRGETVVTDTIDPGLSRVFRRGRVSELQGVGRPWWWKHNVAGLAAVVERAGFRILEPPKRFDMPVGPDLPRPPLRPRTLRTRHGRELMREALRGSPHVAIRAQPAF